MIYTLNKHVRWRKDRQNILICDCKRMIDLKIDFKYQDFLNHLNRGLKEECLNEEEGKVFLDFEKMKLLSEITLRNIKDEEFVQAMDILNNELGRERVRNSEFLYKKFKENGEFFIGLFLDKELIGIICGFPREDYLLMSEIAVDSRYQKRGFGRLLVEKFEEKAREKYNKINVGALNSSINFYKSLKYKPFLLIQFKEGDYDNGDFLGFEIIKVTKYGIELNVTECNLPELERLAKIYHKASLQYIFSKILQ